MSFHIFSGIRHLVWDMGYGFEIKTANITGILVILSSLVATIIFWLISKRIDLMNETRKWILHRVSAVILAPLFAVVLFFIYFTFRRKLINEAIYFFENPSI